MKILNLRIDVVPHKGFGIIRPDQSLSYYQLMIGVWWCFGLRIEREQGIRRMAVYHD